ncbi:hypothetical protein [Alienimonas chondri]|uniref:Uncharacterized protein n=1 Tax=Alienimonas chondri TaxID=2681879 RepID=A0ABX1VI39_9PLAN|nr:hypothetical protein [Alienimonas chondri]NNJ27543.1 hypothetical protein [Alienimonas chondri]
MRDAHGPLSTLLLTAPLLVVPTLAAVGLPGADSSEAPAGLMLGDAALEERLNTFSEEGFDDAFPGTDDPAPSGDDPFGGVEQAADGESDGVRWAAGEDSLFPGAVTTSREVSAGELGESPLASLVPATPVRSTSAQDPDGLVRTAGTAGVRAISARLKEMGAERLDLEPSGDRFYFGCTLSNAAGPGGPVVSRRFEAEADTPAAAANDVFAQVRSFRDATAGRIDSADLALAEPTR